LTARTEESPGAPSDGDLLTRIYVRDVQSLETLYDRHSGFVYALALRVLGRREEAEEIVQDVFWQLWKGRVRYEPERGRFAAWLFAITRSRCLDKIRSQRRSKESDPIPHDAAASELTLPEVQAVDSERQRRVAEALFALPPAQKQALELCFYQGMSHSEIAERLGEPLGTVKSRIKMGMEKLKVHLRAYWNG